MVTEESVSSDTFTVVNNQNWPAEGWQQFVTSPTTFSVQEDMMIFKTDRRNINYKMSWKNFHKNKKKYIIILFKYFAKFNSGPPTCAANPSLSQTSSTKAAYCSYRNPNYKIITTQLISTLYIYTQTFRNLFVKHDGWNI